MKATRLFRILLCFSFLLAIGYQSFGTHLRAGEITVERLNCDNLSFRITITVFTNTRNTTVKFGGDPDLSYLYFGDGQRVFVPETENQIRLDLDPEGSIATASFTVTHTYSSYRQYKISYQEPNRNAGVRNMDNSINTLFYIETVINLDPYLETLGGCSSSPRLGVPPIDKACVGAAWTHNPGAYDPDRKDSISYAMVIPNSAENVNVLHYRDPNEAGFYQNYNTGNEDQNGPPTFGINAVTGTITWDAPGDQGEYNIAFIVIEWRKLAGVWYRMGFVRRDMQIIVEDCDNKRPLLQVPNELCVEAGTVINVPIRGTDPDGDQVKIEAFSPIFQYPPAQSPAAMVYPAPNPAVPKYQPQPAEVRFTWNTECLHVQEQPYQVVFKITDDPPKNKGPKLATFESWTIKVVGPAPKWQGAVLTSNQSTNLSWEPYVCANAEQIQVWRRVDSNPFTPGDCETGMPENAGYELIETLDARDVNNNPVTAYTDTNDGHGLSPAAKYCYRLVAVFPTGGTESYVSAEICVGPIEATAPIITNVSVQKTSTTAGEIFVKWTSPFDADEAAFPRPYTYRIYRGAGVDPLGTNLIATVSDTTFVDTGLNTEEIQYYYRIQAVDNNAQVMDSSKVASSVRATAKSLLKMIQLTWEANVPWSNQINTYPSKHLIYRGPEGAAEADLVLIDSVEVFTQGFRYTDGLVTPLEDDVVYCYRIMTRGGYGNPQIPQPLKNFSQRICAQPGDEEPPCQPIPPLKVSAEECEQYVSKPENCGKNSEFSNTLSWERPEDDECRGDISYYNVYAASSTTSQYILIATNITGTSYEDKNLPSYARCYKISAVDRSGNESPLSEAVCFDNCPYYELPNVFTPNTDDCNRYFSAYSTDERYRDHTNPEAPRLLCGGVSDPSKCARFVERVLFRVYNRWGKEVYSYTGAAGDEENSIYLDWDGRADDNTDLASGVYFYVAEVTFDVVDPGQKLKTIKGWVHLIR